MVGLRAQLYHIPDHQKRRIKVGSLLLQQLEEGKTMGEMQHLHGSDEEPSYIVEKQHKMMLRLRVLKVEEEIPTQLAILSLELFLHC